MNEPFGSFAETLLLCSINLKGIRPFSIDAPRIKASAIALNIVFSINSAIHAPGFYLHIEPGNVFIGVGTWHPAPEALKAIREHIVAKPGPYEDAVTHAPMLEHYEMVGDKLTTPPKGYDKELPLIEEIKRKDFIAVANLNEDFILQPDLPKRLAQLYGTAQPLQRFLCDALKLRF